MPSAPAVLSRADDPFLIFDASADSDRATPERLRDWPGPTIAVAAAATELARLADVHVASLADTELLADNIRRNPIAASVLVHLLRATEKLPLAEALLAESLGYSTLQAGPEFARWLKEKPAPVPHNDAGPAVVIARDGERLIVELNRPSNRNALSVEMRDALNEAFQLAIADDSIRGITVSGRGKCFSVGGDLSEFGTLPDPATAHVIRHLTMPGRFLAQCADRTEFRVHGACIGSGVELPAFAHRVTAAPDTFFHLPELRLGLIPGGGGCVSIPRRIGRQRTAWLILSGKRINARQAQAWGLIDTIAAPNVASH